jgi:hypothetical protein
MGKRSSFEPRKGDFYPTPIEAARPLAPWLNGVRTFAEPCCGDGRLVRHLESFGLACTYSGDIATGQDALARTDYGAPDRIITNPPFTRACLHQLLPHFLGIAPAWLLLEMGFATNACDAPFLAACTDVIPIGRVRWFEGSKHMSCENFGWFQFQQGHHAGPVIRPRGSFPPASSATGANPMQERTAFRLAMLANGFQPLLNACKRPIEKGWPNKFVDEAEVRSWDRSALTSTGLKIDGDLAVIDADVADASLVAALAGALDERFPALFRHGFVRHAGGPKEAWIAHIDEPFRRLASRRWYCGGDPDDPEVSKHQVECFGSLATRQFAIDGPHARNRAGEVISVYQFTAGASPATTPRASLPVLPKAAYAQACDLFDGIAAAAGLTAVSRNSQGEAAARIFELDADTEIETRDHGVMTVGDLECLMRTRQAGASALRCSGSFHDRTRVRTDSHLINWGRRGLGIYDTMTETTWHRRERAPSARFEFLEQLQARNPFHG